MKNFFKKYIEDVKNNSQKENGYILIFALILLVIIFSVSLTASKLVSKNLQAFRITENSKGAFFAADSGIECALYLDNTFTNTANGFSLLPNGSYNNNSLANYSTSLIFNSTSSLLAETIQNINDIQCSDNNIFYTSGVSLDAVSTELEKEVSNYYVDFATDSATTTFGLIIKDGEYNRCALVEVVKEKGDIDGLSKSIIITSKGYSDCDPQVDGRVVNTIILKTKD